MVATFSPTKPPGQGPMWRRLLLNHRFARPQLVFPFQFALLKGLLDFRASEAPPITSPLSPERPTVQQLLYALGPSRSAGYESEGKLTNSALGISLGCAGRQRVARASARWIFADDEIRTSAECHQSLLRAANGADLWQVDEFWLFAAGDKKRGEGGAVGASISRVCY